MNITYDAKTFAHSQLKGTIDIDNLPTPAIRLRFIVAMYTEAPIHIAEELLKGRNVEKRCNLSAHELDTSQVQHVAH